MDLDSVNAENCRKHGYLPHTFLHESAHAVAAIDFGVGFSSVGVLLPEDWIAQGPGFLAGGMVLEPPDVRWSDPVGALKVLLAGAFAERHMLGDAVPRGFSGDFAQWGAHLDHPRQPPPTAVEVLAELGTSWPDVCQATEGWVKAESSRIVRLASALSGRDEADLIAGFPSCDNGPWFMSSAEVSALVGK